MIGEVELIFKRERKETYIAETEVFIFKYDRKVFMNILKQYPEIEEEMKSQIIEREKIKNNQDNIKHMVQEKGLKELINKYFQQIKEAEERH